MSDLIFKIMYWRKIRKARRFIHSKAGEEWIRKLTKRLEKGEENAKNDDRIF
jgi:hypothetical protein